MPIEISNRDRVESFVTMDGSTIRELAGRLSTPVALPDPDRGRRPRSAASNPDRGRRPRSAASNPDRGHRPRSAASNHQSLAEAVVPAGGETIEHRHRESEEIYYFIAGQGRIRLGGDERDVGAGDCVVIAPGTPHKLWAATDGNLVLLCACAPPYRDDDTELLEALA